MYNKVDSMQKELPQNVEYFKEEMVCQVLSIPQGKPDLMRLLNTMTWIDVEALKLIETPRGRSYEGQYLSGYKLVIEMRVKTKLTYASNMMNQQGTYAEYYETLKSTFVILPEVIGGQDVKELYRLNRFDVTPYTEAKCERILDTRAVYQCVLVLVDVKNC